MLAKLSKVLGVSFLLIGFFNSQVFQNNSLAYSNDEYNPYLSQEDLEFNLAQVVTTEEGFLVKNVPATTEESLVAEFKEHTVLEGEDLVAIANFYGLDVNTIILENKIVNIADVSVGDILKVPPTDGVSHVVASGENLSYIASLYSVDYKQIEAFNILDVYNLSIGEKIFVPGGKRVTTSLVADTATKLTPESTKVANLETELDASILPEYPEPAEITLNTEAPKQALEPQSPNTPAIPQFNLEGSTGFTTGPEAQINDTKIVTVEKEVVVEVPKAVSQPVAAPANVAKAPVSESQWGKPTSGNVTQGYRKGHYALDIAERGRPPIWAAADGVVETAAYGWNSGFGNYVIIDHKNGYKTLYAHNTELYVKPGDTVKKGQAIAKMGNTGRVYGATGIHLHYECHLEGIRINPYTCMP